MKNGKTFLAIALFGAMLASCNSGGGGDSPDHGPTTYTVGGIVSGLTGTGLALRNNGADDLAIVSDGTFTFSQKLVSGASYSVTIKTPPFDPTLTCVITNNTGTVLAKAVEKVLVICHQVAGAATSPISDNLLTDLATAPEPPTGWTQVVPGGNRTGIVITTGAGIGKVYLRNDQALNSDENWAIEAVVSAPPLCGAGERGARMSIRFRDPSALMLPPVGIDKFRYIQLSLAEEGSGNRRFALVDGNGGSEKASLACDWASTAPRWRIRIKREGTDIIMEAEPAHTGPLMADPLNFSKPAPYTVTVQIANFSFPVGTFSDFGFGHFLPGAYSSYWESVLVTRATDSTTVLPYWPATPPAPTLVHDDKGSSGQVVVSSVDLGSPPMTVPYLSTDVATLSLIHSGGTSTVSIADPSTTNDGLQYTTFSGLAGGQTASGFVTVCDVSGRCSSSTTVGVVIP